MTEVKRKKYMLTREELISHLKEVGQAIIDDADKIAPDPQHCGAIEISAEIEPLMEVTQVKYVVCRNADPRLKGENK